MPDDASGELVNDWKNFVVNKCRTEIFGLSGSCTGEVKAHRNFIKFDCTLERVKLVRPHPLGWPVHCDISPPFSLGKRYENLKDEDLCGSLFYPHPDFQSWTSLVESWKFFALI